MALDSAPLIYFLEGRGARGSAVRELLAAARGGACELVVSAITEAELLVGPLRADNPKATDAVRAMLGGSLPVHVVEVTRPIARAAAGLRARFGLRVADALVVASALDADCTALVSNDAALRRVGDLITYIHLDDHVRRDAP